MSIAIQILKQEVARTRCQSVIVATFTIYLYSLGIQVVDLILALDNVVDHIALIGSQW